MSFSAKIVSSLVLAAAVAASPASYDSYGAPAQYVNARTADYTAPAAYNGARPRDYGNRAVRRVHGNRRRGGRKHSDDSDSYSDDGSDRESYRLVRRGEYGSVGRANERYAGRKAGRRGQNSSDSSSSDSDAPRYDSMRPAFSRETPTVRQLQYERAVANRGARYSRLQRRGYSDDAYSSDGHSSESDSYGRDYRRSLRRRPSNDYRLARRGLSDRRVYNRNDRRRDYSSASSGSESDGYYGSGARPARFSHADEYYGGVAARRNTRGRRNDEYRLVRRGEYVEDKYVQKYDSDKGKKKKKSKKSRKGSDSDSSSGSDSSSDSDNDKKKKKQQKKKPKKQRKDSDSEDDYKSDVSYGTGYQPPVTYGGGAQPSFNNSYQPQETY